MNEEYEVSTDWVKEFERVTGNAVYFLELYYNKAYPDKAVELNDEQRQQYFDRYKKIPVFKMGPADAYLKYDERLRELKSKGYKDWEIL